MGEPIDDTVKYDTASLHDLNIHYCMYGMYIVLHVHVHVCVICMVHVCIYVCIICTCMYTILHVHVRMCLLQV